MTATIQSLGIDKMSVEDRIQLAVAIWDSIAESSPSPLVTDLQKAELERRLQDKKDNPDDFTPWAQIRTEALARLHK